MKKVISILIISFLMPFIGTGQTLINTKLWGDSNVLIGIGAGEQLTTESLCVIVGHDKEAKALKGKDMLWSVDWDEPYLNSETKDILFDYYNNFILKCIDSRENRSYLFHRIKLLSEYITQGNGTTFLNEKNAKPNLPKTDTIGVILLVNDTDGNPMSYIIKGYSVRNRYNQNEESGGDWYCYSCNDYMKHSYYLDAKKRRLTSSVIVWMSQPSRTVTH